MSDNDPIDELLDELRNVEDSNDEMIARLSKGLPAKQREHVKTFLNAAPDILGPECVGVYLTTQMLGPEDQGLAGALIYRAYETVLDHLETLTGNLDALADARAIRVLALRAVVGGRTDTDRYAHTLYGEQMALLCDVWSRNHWTSLEYNRAVFGVDNDNKGENDMSDNDPHPASSMEEARALLQEHHDVDWLGTVDVPVDVPVQEKVNDEFLKKVELFINASESELATFLANVARSY